MGDSRDISAMGTPWENGDVTSIYIYMYMYLDICKYDDLMRFHGYNYNKIYGFKQTQIHILIYLHWILNGPVVI